MVMPDLDTLFAPMRLDGSCRRDYGPPVVRSTSTKCAYCERDLFASYEAWLNLSVDHVIPSSTKWADSPAAAWLNSLANFTTCCRACNEFLNGFRCSVPPPSTREEFLVLRQEVLAQKAAQAKVRHERELQLFEGMRQAAEA